MGLTYSHLVHLKGVLTEALNTDIINNLVDDPERSFHEIIDGSHIDIQMRLEFLEDYPDWWHRNVPPSLTFAKVIEQAIREHLKEDLSEAYVLALDEATWRKEILKDYDNLKPAFELYVKAKSSPDYYEDNVEEADRIIEELGYYEDWEMTFIWEHVYEMYLKETK